MTCSSRDLRQGEAEKLGYFKGEHFPSCSKGNHTPGQVLGDIVIFVTYCLLNFFHGKLIYFAPQINPKECIMMNFTNRYQQSEK